MELGKTSHSVYKIRYHMVTSVKNRKALPNSEIEDCITKTLQGISERYEIVIDEVGFDQDHIHILCGAPSRMAPLRVISIIKSITAQLQHGKYLKDSPISKSKSCGVANFGAMANILVPSEKPHQRKRSGITSEIIALIRKRQKLG